MNEKTAIEKGYRYTGAGARWMDEATAIKKAQFTDKGYKAVIVKEKENPLSRGYGRGFCGIYAEERYFLDKRIEKLQGAIDLHPKRLANLMMKHKAELETLWAEHNERKESLEKAISAREAITK